MYDSSLQLTRHSVQIKSYHNAASRIVRATFVNHHGTDRSNELRCDASNRQYVHAASISNSGLWRRSQTSRLANDTELMIFSPLLDFPCPHRGLIYRCMKIIKSLSVAITLLLQQCDRRSKPKYGVVGICEGEETKDK